LSYGTRKKDITQVQNQINIELSEEIAEGIYSNLAMIAHSNSEFVIDFHQADAGRAESQG
jgi:hypothetical protein